MKEISLAVLLFSAVNSWAAHGIIQTSEGRKMEGEIRLERDSLVITDTNNASVTVNLAELSLARFQTPPPNTSSRTGVVEVSRGTNEFSNPDSKTGQEVSLDSKSPASPLSVSKPNLPAGILLTGGSMIARRISSADDTSVRFFDSPREAAISTVNVARLLFQPLPSELEGRILPGRTGVLLSSREFIEGEFRSFSGSQIKMSSVLLGVKNYDPGQVIGVILREPKPARARFELKTRDESLFLVNALRIEKNSILLQDPELSGLRIALAELVELRRRRE